MDDDDDERTIELSSIEAIYPELVLNPAKPYAATLDLPVTPYKPLRIYFQSSTSTVPAGLLTPPTTEGTETVDIRVTSADPAPLANALKVDVHELAHLPPLKIDISLPNGYPQLNPPIVAIRSDPSWLPEKTLKEIQGKCIELWQECGQDQVLFTFIDHIQQEAEKAFGLPGGTDQEFKLPSDLKLILLDYDLKCKQERFDNETFDCGICLEPKKGKICHRLLLCGHVFCVACLQDFYNACITEGDIDNIKCLDPGCGKNIGAEVSPGKRRKVDHTLNPSELLQIPIEQELVQRYVRLKRKKKLESDKNTIYCPRQWCQGAAKSKKHPKSDDLLNDEAESENEPEPDPQPKSKKKKQNVEDIPMSERLAVCEDCNFAFCSVCKKGWHGELARCNPRRQAELNEEEKASLEYLQKYSTPCPTCSAPAQKTFGCNHMICFKCKSHFCYLCSSYLMPDNPYRHFNELKSTCYMRLWELEGGDGADVGIGYGGGNAAPWQPEDFDSDDSDSDISDEELEEFGGNDLVNWDDDESDSDEDEPAPDQRRANRPHIEIVNFAGNGAGRRIELPDRPGQAAPPPAPAPPQQGRRRRRRPNARPQPEANARMPQGAPVQQVRAAVAAQEPAQVAAAAPGQGNNLDGALQRFLQLAVEDREDEWDSDEDDIAEPVQGRRAQNRRR